MKEYIGRAPLWCIAPVWVPKRMGPMDPLGRLVRRTIRDPPCLIFVAATCIYLHDFFTTHFLTSSWYPHFLDFGANLVSTCPPTWSQNPPKIDPRAVQHPSQLPSYHRPLF